MVECSGLLNRRVARLRGFESLSLRRNVTINVMFIYLLASTVGALIQIATIYFLKQDILKSFLFAIPFILAYQFLFLFSYTKAPNFIFIWFVTTALTNSLAFILGYFLYHNHLSYWGFAGVALILIGVVFLQIK